MAPVPCRGASDTVRRGKPVAQPFRAACAGPGAHRRVRVLDRGATPRRHRRRRRAVFDCQRPSGFQPRRGVRIERLRRALTRRLLARRRIRLRSGDDVHVPRRHLGTTHERAPVGFAGLAIGLALTLIHLISIPVTNTSVNPARSTATALIAGDWARAQLWLFWLPPVVGAAVAGFAYKPLFEA